LIKKDDKVDRIETVRKMVEQSSSAISCRNQEGSVLTTTTKKFKMSSKRLYCFSLFFYLLKKLLLGETINIDNLENGI
jgi:hypothetical protein